MGTQLLQELDYTSHYSEVRLAKVVGCFRIPNNNLFISNKEINCCAFVESTLNNLKTEVSMEIGFILL